MMGFGLVGLLLVLVLIAVVGGGFFRQEGSFLSGPGSAGAGPVNSPLGAKHILDERYARGEITREEYRQAKQDLANS